MSYGSGLGQGLKNLGGFNSASVQYANVYLPNAEGEGKTSVSIDKFYDASRTARKKLLLLSFDQANSFEQPTDLGAVQINRFIADLPISAGLYVDTQNQQSRDIGLFVTHKLLPYSFLYLDNPSQEQPGFCAKILKRLSPKTILFISQALCQHADFGSLMGHLNAEVNLCIDHALLAADPDKDKLQDLLKQKEHINLFMPLAAFYGDKLGSVIDFVTSLTKPIRLTVYIHSQADVEAFKTHIDKFKKTNLTIQLLIDDVAEKVRPTPKSDSLLNITSILNAFTSHLPQVHLMATTREALQSYQSFQVASRQVLEQRKKENDELSFLTVHYLDDLDANPVTALGKKVFPPLTIFNSDIFTTKVEPTEAENKNMVAFIATMPAFCGVDLSNKTMRGVFNYLKNSQNDSLLFFDKESWKAKADNNMASRVLTYMTKKEYFGITKDPIIYIPFLDLSTIQALPSFSREIGYSLLLAPEYFSFENTPHFNCLLESFNKINFFIPPLAIYRQVLQQLPLKLDQYAQIVTAIPFNMRKYTFDFFVDLNVEDEKFKWYQEKFSKLSAIGLHRVIVNPMTDYYSHHESSLMGRLMPFGALLKQMTEFSKVFYYRRPVPTLADLLSRVFKKHCLDNFFTESPLAGVSVFDIENSNLKVKNPKGMVVKENSFWIKSDQHLIENVKTMKCFDVLTINPEHKNLRAIVAAMPASTGLLIQTDKAIVNWEWIESVPAHSYIRLNDNLWRSEETLKNVLTAVLKHQKQFFIPYTLTSEMGEAFKTAYTASKSALQTQGEIIPLSLMFSRYFFHSEYMPLLKQFLTTCNLSGTEGKLTIVIPPHRTDKQEHLKTSVAYLKEKGFTFVCLLHDQKDLEFFNSLFDSNLVNGQDLLDNSIQVVLNPIPSEKEKIDSRYKQIYMKHTQQAIEQKRQNMMQELRKIRSMTPDSGTDSNLKPVFKLKSFRFEGDPDSSDA